MSSIAVQEELLLARERAAAAASARTAPKSADAPPSAQAPVASDDDEAGGAGRNAEDRGGLTALVFAARQGDLESVRVLLEAGADVNQTTEYGWTALLVATQNRYYRLGKFLLEHGADPNIANKGGWTPLYIATDNRNIEGGDYPVAQAGHGSPRVHQAAARQAAPTQRAHAVEHRDAHDLHASVALRGGRDAVPARGAVGRIVLLKLLLEHGADPKIETVQA